MTGMTLKVGLTPEHECSYLPPARERLMVLLDESYLSAAGYEYLLQAGFRRSGSDIYRPHCQACLACRSLRINVNDFVPSRNQRRIWKRNQDLKLVISSQDKPEYYALYARYITLRHSDGSMFPPSRNQYDHFLLCRWMPPLFMEFRLGQQLLAVAVTDAMPHSLSAMYTFFEPTQASRSPGTFSILSQIEWAKKMRRQWLYLGYQVDDCDKMNYKNQFHPHEQLIDREWKKFDSDRD